MAKIRPELTRRVYLKDIEYVSKNLRAGDRAEAEALGLVIGPALRTSVTASTIAMTLLDPHTGQPGAILGAGPRPYPGFGIIWCVGTQAIEENAMVFLRQSREVLPTLFDRTGVQALGNFVHVKNELHIKWLRWLGFMFINKVQLGPQGEEFYEFVKMKG